MDKVNASDGKKRAKSKGVIKTADGKETPITSMKGLLDAIKALEQDADINYSGEVSEASLKKISSAVKKCEHKLALNLSGATGLTKIGRSAFDGCTSLASVTIPGSITKIGGCAFFGCKSLASVTISESVTEIGGWAFLGCKSLKTIEIIGDGTRKAAMKIANQCGTNPEILGGTEENKQEQEIEAKSCNEWYDSDEDYSKDSIYTMPNFCCQIDKYFGAQEIIAVWLVFSDANDETQETQNAMDKAYEVLMESAEKTGDYNCVFPVRAKNRIFFAVQDSNGYYEKNYVDGFDGRGRIPVPFDIEKLQSIKTPFGIHVFRLWYYDDDNNDFSHGLVARESAESPFKLFQEDDFGFFDSRYDDEDSYTFSRGDMEDSYGNPVYFYFEDREIMLVKFSQKYYISESPLAEAKTDEDGNIKLECESEVRYWLPTCQEALQEEGLYLEATGDSDVYRLLDKDGNRIRSIKDFDHLDNEDAKLISADDVILKDDECYLKASAKEKYLKN